MATGSETSKWRTHLKSKASQVKARTKIPASHSRLASLRTSISNAGPKTMTSAGFSPFWHTGARLSEIVGLGFEDIVIDATPHIKIQPRPWRGLKNASSARTVPLVGAALWAAARLQETSLKGQKFAFPRYVSDDECRATAASGALASWLRRKGFAHVPHELRHTMADRLRSVQCPKEIRYAIDGHAAQDVGDGYGTGFGPMVKAEWLAKVALENPASGKSALPT